MKDGAGIHVPLEPGTFRPVMNRDNDYQIDRAAQKAGRYYSGVRSIAIQDASVQESMGPIADRTTETLVATDIAIVQARRFLAKAADALKEGIAPPGLDPATHRVRSASFILPASEPLKDAAAEAIKVREGQPHMAV
jgi:phthalate 4,5-dioxygenase